MKTQEKIVGIIAKLSFITAEDIKASDSLITLGFDSLKMVELIVALEDNLNIIFNDSELNPENLTTVESLINLVNLKKEI